MTYTILNLTLSHLISLFRGHSAVQPPRLPEPQPESSCSADQTCEDRAFLMDMLDRHPEALQGDYGMMKFMDLYRYRRG